MHLLGAGTPDHLHDLPGRRPPDNGIVDDDHPLALDDVAHRVELDFHTEVPNRLLGFNESPSHVVIAHQAEFEPDPRFLGIPQGGGHSRVRHRYDDVGLKPVLAGQLPAEFLSHHVDVLAEYV